MPLLKLVPDNYLRYKAKLLKLNEQYENQPTRRSQLPDDHLESILLGNVRKHF